MEQQNNVLHQNKLEIWPEWTLESVLGKGSYGTVYKASRHTTNIDSYSAIKVIPIPQDPSEKQRLKAEGMDTQTIQTYYRNMVTELLREIDLMNSLKGVQNIVSIEDYQVVENQENSCYTIYIRMELLRSFESYLEQKQMLTQEEVLKLGIDICNALELCAKKNIVHRDIKPENIFVNDFGHFKLGDFGIARKLEGAKSGMSQKGTLSYIAPEIVTCNNYDARVDIYSLGLVMYRLLNQNHLPFLENQQQMVSPGARQQALDRRIHGEPLPPPSMANTQVANIILKACAHNPANRFASAEEMKNCLQQALNSLGSPSQSTAATIPQNNLDTTWSVKNHAAVSNEQLVNNLGNPPQQTATPSGNKKKIVIPIVIASSVVSFFLILAIILGVVFGQDMLNAIKKQDDFEDLASTTVSYVPKSEEYMEMPACQGMTMEAVQNTFGQTDHVVSYEYQYHDTVPQNSVISQSIPQGTKLPSGSTIVFVISKGPSVCPYPYQQKVQVTASAGSSKGTLILYQWENGDWAEKLRYSATLGKKGIGLNYGEGTGVTPQGTFKLGVVLTKSALSGTTWPYQVVNKSTCVVDDVNSPYYNTIQNIGSLPKGTHYDAIGATIVNGKTNKCMYIEHNGNGLNSQGVVPGKGSVITICGRNGTLAATNGCIDISSNNFNTLLAQLDYSKNPHVEILTK